MGFWRDRPVLVTGATGLLGSWLVPRLLAEGARVVALVRDVVPDALFETSGDRSRHIQLLKDQTRRFVLHFEFREAQEQFRALNLRQPTLFQDRRQLGNPGFDRPGERQELLC